jgi:hypothetical protein
MPLLTVYATGMSATTRTPRLAVLWFLADRSVFPDSYFKSEHSV